MKWPLGTSTTPSAARSAPPAACRPTDDSRPAVGSSKPLPIAQLHKSPLREPLRPARHDQIEETGPAPRRWSRRRPSPRLLGSEPLLIYYRELETGSARAFKIALVR